MLPEPPRPAAGAMFEVMIGPEWRHRETLLADALFAEALQEGRTFETVAYVMIGSGFASFPFSHAKRKSRRY